MCYTCTTDSNHNLPKAPNLLNQKIKVDGPNTVWVNDILLERAEGTTERAGGMTKQDEGLIKRAGETIKRGEGIIERAEGTTKQGEGVFE